MQKASDIIILIGQIRDIRAIITVLLQSPAIKAPLKQAYMQLLAQLESSFQGLKTLFRNNISIDQNNLFTIAFECTLEEQSIVTAANLLLQSCKEEKVLKEYIVNILNFRRVFFEFLETEHRFIERCHEITPEKVATIKQVANDYFSDNKFKQQQFDSVSGLLDCYFQTTNLLRVSCEEALRFAEDPYCAVKFLCDQLASVEFEETYQTLEKLSVNYQLLNQLLNEVVQHKDEAKQLLSPLLAHIAEPFQRTARYPLLIKQATEGERLNILSKFYQQHQAPQLENLRESIDSLNQLLQRMERNVNRVNELIRHKEKHSKQEEQQRRQEYLLQIKKDYETMRIRGGLTSSQPREVVELMTHHNSPVDDALLKSAYANDKEAAKKALQDGADINAREDGILWGNYTPLIIASFYGYVEFVEFLLNLDFKQYPLDTRAQTHTRSVPYNTALHWAAREGHEKVVVLLTAVDPEAGVIRSSENGYTPLHWAVKKHHDMCAKHLIEACGAEMIGIRNNKNKTAFEMAFDENQIELVQYMLQQLSKNHEGNALKEAVAYIKKNENKKHKHWGQVLFGKLSKLEEKFLNAARNGDLPALIDALNAGVDINCRANGAEFGNYTALIFASRFDHKECVAYLLGPVFSKWQVDTCAQTYFNIRNTALHWAARCGNNKIVELLLNADLGPLTIKEDEFGYNPLHWAVSSNYSETVQLLLKPNVIKQLKQKANDGVTTPFRLAVNLGHWQIAELLLQEIINTNNSKLIEEAVGYIYLRMRIEDFQKTKPRAATVLLENLRGATADEITVLMDMLQVSTDRNYPFLEFLRGGHFKIKDESMHYSRWMQFKNKKNRQAPGASSHFSIDPQHSIQGLLLKECLFGTAIVDEVKCSWVQLEKYSTGIVECLGHGMSFVEYKVTGNNVGPYGNSPLTEASPGLSRHAFCNGHLQKPIWQLLLTMVKSYVTTKSVNLGINLDPGGPSGVYH